MRLHLIWKTEDIQIEWKLIHSHSAWLNQTKVRSPKLYPGLSHGWQGDKDLNIICCFPGYELLKSCIEKGVAKMQTWHSKMRCGRKGGAQFTAPNIYS